MISVFIYDHGVRIHTYRFQNEKYEQIDGKDTTWIEGILESGENKHLIISGKPTIVVEKDVS